MTSWRPIGWSQPGGEWSKNVLDLEHSVKWKVVLCGRSVADAEGMVREEAAQAGRSRVMKGLEPLCGIWALSRRQWRIFHNEIHIFSNAIVNVTSS